MFADDTIAEDLEDAVTLIALRTLQISSLDLEGNTMEDYHNLRVDKIKSALQQAYLQGARDVTKGLTL